MSLIANIIGGIFVGLIAVGVYLCMTGTGIDDLKSQAARLGWRKRAAQQKFYRPARRTHAAA